jgi:hypothetical protein
MLPQEMAGKSGEIADAFFRISFLIVTQLGKRNCLDEIFMLVDLRNYRFSNPWVLEAKHRLPDLNFLLPGVGSPNGDVLLIDDQIPIILKNQDRAGIAVGG